jgi:hypothetical protein
LNGATIGASKTRRIELPDVIFKEELLRLRKDSGAHDVAVVCHFALHLVRRAGNKKSIDRRRKCAAFDEGYLARILAGPPR